MKSVKDFLAAHWDRKSPLLIGYSGGPDSKALLYSLVESGCATLHIAHVDHGWREESGKEAEAIQKEAALLNIPFHKIRLEKNTDANAEAVARVERLKFFRSLFDKIPFQALLLGHQAGDLAETALKRLLEGAHLPFLGGMERVSSLEGMTVWRPLLKTKKGDILRFLEERNLKPFMDPTNLDPAYLRSRLRKETLPFLNASFGKDVLDNLCHLSERSHELKRYLEKKVEGRQIQKGEWGFAMFCGGLEKIERRYLLQKTFTGEGIVLNRKVLEPLIDWLDEKRLRRVYFQSHWILASRGWAVALPSKDRKVAPKGVWIRSLPIFQPVQDKENKLFS